MNHRDAGAFAAYVNAEGGGYIVTAKPGGITDRWLVRHPLGLNEVVYRWPTGLWSCTRCTARLGDAGRDCEHIRAVQAK